MYILLQNQNKTFIPYNRNSDSILLKYTGMISENHIIKWLKEQFNMDVIKAEINTVNKNVIAVLISLCNDIVGILVCAENVAKNTYQHINDKILINPDIYRVYRDSLVIYLV